ncbi:hypothetical protein GCM10010430_44070 [Kitasatospora cystarginea]|uniref:Uncharacterized protein n=1 Tax=Kitasatospora cystarginea TaxID=58350 RepID=A0ABP5R9Z2_9ACTN
MRTDDDSDAIEDEYALLPFWVPRVETTRIPTGRHWAAVRVTAADAEKAHRLLGPDSGPVIANPYAGVWFFLLDDLGATWEPTRTARLLREGTLIAVHQGHVRHGRDVHWAVPPGLGSTLADDLRAALDGKPPPRRWPPARSSGQPGHRLAS